MKEGRISDAVYSLSWFMLGRQFAVPEVAALAERCWDRVYDVTQQLLKPSQPVSDLSQLSIEERALHQMTSSCRKSVSPGYCWL